jgi:Flp pilus assembly protein TadB
MNASIKYMGITVLIATVLAYAVAGLERAATLSEEQDRMTVMENAHSWRDGVEAIKRLEEQHRDALAGIERKYYMHFALTWLVTTGALLALSGRAAKHWGWLRDDDRQTPIP